MTLAHQWRDPAAPDPSAESASDRYLGILNTLHSPVCRWRPDGKVTFINDAYCRLKGVTRETFTQVDLNACIHADDLDRARVALAELGPDRRFAQIEFRIVDADGDTRWMMWNYYAIVDVHGQIVEYQGSGQDITDRVEADNEARKNQRMLRDVIDALPVCIAFLGSDYRYRLVNDAYETWFDRNRAEFIGKHAADVLGEAAFRRLQPHLDRVLRGHASNFQGLVAYQTAGERYVHASYVPNFDQDGEVDGFFSVVTDLSDRHRANIALQKSEDRFRRLIETSPDTILVHRDGEIRYANGAAARALRVASAGRLVGRRIDDFIHPDHIDYVRGVGAAGRGGKPPELKEIVMHRYDGTDFDVEITGISLMYRDRPAVQLICRDITARKNAQAQLIQSSKLATLGEMAAGMAHELNQPLNVIRMAADNSLFFIDEDNRTDIGFHRGQFETIAEQVNRMAAIIDHMREYSRIDDGTATSLDPFEIVRRSCAFFTETFRTENIALEIDLPALPVRVRGHKILLEQLFVTLLQNAADAILMHRARGGLGPKEGTIRIAASVTDGREISICITDNGGGIAPAIAKRLFEPFVTTKPVGSGTGLGLSVANEIIKRMSGCVVAENLNDGAQFTVQLPLYVDAASEVAQVAE